MRRHPELATLTRLCLFGFPSNLILTAHHKRIAVELAKTFWENESVSSRARLSTHYFDLVMGYPLRGFILYRNIIAFKYIN